VLTIISILKAQDIYYTRTTHHPVAVCSRYHST